MISVLIHNHLLGLWSDLGTNADVGEAGGWIVSCLTLGSTTVRKTSHILRLALPQHKRAIICLALDSPTARKSSLALGSTNAQKRAMSTSDPHLYTHQKITWYQIIYINEESPLLTKTQFRHTIYYLHYLRYYNYPNYQPHCGSYWLCQ